MKKVRRSREPFIRTALTECPFSLSGHSLMIRNPLRRKRRPNLDDRTFGAISMTTEGYWESPAFRFAGYEDVQLLVDGDESGPTEAQRHFFHEVSARFDELESRIRQALSAYREDHPSQERFRLAAIYISSFRDQVRKGGGKGVRNLFVDPGSCL